MSPEELRSALDHAIDEDALRLVIQSCAGRLRGPNDDDRIGLVVELAPFVLHTSQKVRRAMADACDAFPGRLFDDAFEALSADRDHFVCAAARRAGERRAEQRKATSRLDAADHVAAEIAAEIERRYDKGAKTLARRLVRREMDQYLERMNHETMKLNEAIDRTLEAIEAELAKPDASVAALRARMVTLRERVVLQRSLMQRARDYARTVRPVFALEGVLSMVDEARAQLVDRLRERAPRLDLVADIPATLTMHADRHAILQALQNLLQNAVEAYAAGEPRLTVRVVARARSKGTLIELRVEDDGAGIGEDAKQTLFVPFYSNKPGGTGVGLLMARKMVEEVHGGSLEVDSTFGKGTAVVLTMPARQAAVRERS